MVKNNTHSVLCTYYAIISWCVGGSKANDCVINRLLPTLQMVCNTVMSLIENSISPLIDQRLKQCQATHSMKKNFHTAKPAEYAMLIQYYMTQKD